MLARVLRYFAAKLGSHYPKVALVVQFSFAHLVVLGGVGLLLLYQDVSARDFGLIVAVSQGLMLVENVFATRFASCLLNPVRLWLRGQRDESSTVTAWEALATFPASFTRRWVWRSVLLNVLPATVFMTYQLGLPFYVGPILLAGGLVVLGYGLLLRFFALELAMRPVLERIAGGLPETFRVEAGGLSLRWKLLAVLPAINVITGVVVAGLSNDDSSQLTDLGLDVTIAVAVAFALSFELSVLLARSVYSPLDDLRRATERLGEGDLGARVPVLSSDETGRLAQSFNAMASGLEERERLHEAFGTFVDPDVADRVMREGTLSGDEVEVSVLFLDIRDFTAFAERSSAREVVDRLNDFYERIVPVLLRHGGHANKFIGDGLLGVFGAPDLRRDHADRAVAAACEIAALVNETYGDSLRIGIGVNSGPVVAGTIGGGGRLDFTVIGDPVNTASRVEAMTRKTGDQVLLTEATRCLLTRDFGGFEERPAAVLRGKAERVQLYAPAQLTRLPADREGAAPAALR